MEPSDDMMGEVIKTEATDMTNEEKHRYFIEEVVMAIGLDVCEAKPGDKVHCIKKHTVLLTDAFLESIGITPDERYAWFICPEENVLGKII